MKLVVSKKISPRNINLAYLESTKVRSDDVLQIRDKSIEYVENQIPIFTEARRTTSDEYGQLNITNDTLCAKITSEYNYIKETAKYVPLWLRYRLKNMHYNNTARTKIVRYTIASDISEYQVISPKSTSLIVPNTIVVEYKQGDTWNTMPTNKYVYDNGKKILILTADALALYNGYSMRINYYIINYSISIYDDLGNKIDARYFRIDLSKYETDPDGADKFVEVDNDFLNNIYETDILLANILEDDKTYFIEYTSYDFDNSTTTNSIEVLNTNDLYQKVDELKSYHTKESYVFTINESTYNINTRLDENWPIVFVKYPTDRNSNIVLLEPQNKPHDVPWFMEVSNDKFTRTIDSETYTYRVSERLSQNVIGDSYTIKTSKEDIVKIDSTTIKVNYDNMHLNYDNDGNITNIIMINADTNITSYIDWVDAKRGLIKLTRDININQADNYIEYQYKIFNIQYQDVNVNPYMVFNETNNNIIDKFMVFFMMPEEELDTSKGRSLFHLMVYKSPERYDEVSEHQKSIANATEHIEGLCDGEGSIVMSQNPVSGIAIQIGNDGDTYTESTNLFTESESWNIASGVTDTTNSLSNAINLSENYSAEDRRDSGDIPIGTIKVYGKEDQNITVVGDSTGVTTYPISGSVSNLYSMIGEYLNSGIVDQTNLHPIILGYVGATNITTAAGIKMRDIRRRGGGLSVNEAVNELTDNYIRHYLDVAKFDGYDYDLSNMAIVKIKQSVKDTLIELMTEYDPVAQRAIRDDSSFSIEQYVEAYIANRVRKYLDAGCSFTIQYIED